MNNTNNTERNEQMVRVMAVVGFVVLICLLAWLAVQAVRFIPTAFSSLANIFEANQRDYEEGTTPTDNEVVVVPEDEEENEEEVTGNDNKTPDVAATSTVATTSKPVVTKPTPVQYKTVVTHKIPVSDPNGKTDLAVTFVAFGYMNANGKFVPQSELSDKEHGAIQFVVKNNGTKTSTDWTFEAVLPNGSKMTSKNQIPLKPSESSTLTIVFGQVSDRGNHTVDVGVFGGQDVNPANNAFRTTLRVK